MGLNVLLVHRSDVMGSLLLRTLRQSGLPIAAVSQSDSWKGALVQRSAATPDLLLVDADLLTDGAGQRYDLGVSPWVGIPCVVLLPEGSRAPVGAGESDVAVKLSLPFTPQAVRGAVLQVLSRRHPSGAGAKASHAP